MDCDPKFDRDAIQMDVFDEDTVVDTTYETMAETDFEGTKPEMPSWAQDTLLILIIMKTL